MSSGWRGVVITLRLTCSAAVSEITTAELYTILDDVVYKMSSSSNPVIGSAAVKILLSITEQKSHSVSLPLHERYKGNLSPCVITSHCDQVTDVYRCLECCSEKWRWCPAGLEDMVQKDWRGKGFDATLRQLIHRLQYEGPEKDTQVCVKSVNSFLL